MNKTLFFFLFISFFSCKKPNESFLVTTKEMTDAQYPDNPNLESRHSEAKQILFKSIKITEQDGNLFNFDLISHEANALKISLKKIPVLEMMPTAPKYIQKDDYLTYIGIINQEWNRQQVRFNKGQFLVSGNDKIEITRVDLARNCLNAYLWEVLVYAKDKDGKDKLYWQCWFDFPKDAYKNLFEIRNNLPFETFQKGLENWIDPETKKIDLSVLREIKTEKEINFQAKNEEMYPIKGERERKRKNIIIPKEQKNMTDFLNDSTLFATFSVPGFYNKKDPRKTQLSTLGKLIMVVKRQVINALGDDAIEYELDFVSNSDKQTITKFIIGGINLKQIPTLTEADANDGWQTSMGVANHSFYETFDFMKAHPTEENGFYSFLLDEDNNFIDSHKIGIDGPLLHFDKNKKLHLWILAFERHAFEGHYVFE